MNENNLETATFAAGCFWGVEEKLTGGGIRLFLEKPGKRR